MPLEAGKGEELDSCPEPCKEQRETSLPTPWFKPQMTCFLQNCKINKFVLFGRWEGGSGWGTHVNSWLIHVNA